MKFLFRTALLAVAAVLALSLASAAWIESSARDSCASVGSSLSRVPSTNGSSPTLVESILPDYQIGERHSIYIGASPVQVFRAFGNVKGDERPIARLFGLLPMLAGKGDVSSPSENKPLLRALREESGLVLEKPHREFVAANIGTVDAHTPSTPDTAEGFVSYRLKHNELKLPVDFRADPEGEGTRLTTETRMMFDDRELCHDFAWYWGVIYPGSSLLRTELLKTIEYRAEHGIAPGARAEDPKHPADGGVR